ncbi:alpha/beta hydrolase [Clostridium algidicarnis]|uniref:Alpha/beta hydrolase family protein n=2 Tax=Clostridium algidicarnis TaxID=37659 RepID=A0A2S6FW85_9CLOT|nr:alpha/beta family hydrolase [Clostridium algidicarnis]MBU3220753.1 alpha/beta hydrolase [Clostridium algidicarnis]PPK47850.1 alpha/beta hydrolase family protein [Clostridium algidicarnis DSM 15099]
MKQKRSFKFKVFRGIAIFLIIMVSTFFVYVSSYYKSSSLALDALKSDSLVTVEENGDILFKPIYNNKNIGFIFYPGAKVEASAYAPIAKEIASKGYTVVIAKMSFNLAILSPNKAENIVSKHKDINSWVIGGHSLGGVMAADYALKNNKIKGLVFLASYPKDKKDFTSNQIKVLSLWGSNDKVANLNKIKEAKNVMPSDSEFIEIEGGNHSGFGDYGYQKGDGDAFITNKEQMSDTSKSILNLLDNLN